MNLLSARAIWVKTSSLAVYMALMLGAIVICCAFSLRRSSVGSTPTPYTGPLCLDEGNECSIPTPYPPKAQWGYIPVHYWNTAASTGFDAVDPLASETINLVTFTISKGKTGIAILGIESVYVYAPGTAPIGRFNVSFIINQLPEGVTVTFDPAHFTISPEQGAQVKTIITVNQDAPLKGEADITGKIYKVGLEAETGNRIETSLDCVIMVTTP